MFKQAYFEAIRSQPGRRPDGMLWVSDLGNDPYWAMARILGSEREPFDDASILRMEGGNALEGNTVNALARMLGNAQTQFPLYNDKWSGYADLVLYHGGLLKQPVIVEHKACQDAAFQYGVVKDYHVCQLWLYGELYRQQYHRTPRLVLLYRGWSKMVEVEIERVEVAADQWTMVTKMIDQDGPAGYSDTVTDLRFDPAILRMELEACYDSRSLPIKPIKRSFDYVKERFGR